MRCCLACYPCPMSLAPHMIHTAREIHTHTQKFARCEVSDFCFIFVLWCVPCYISLSNRMCTVYQSRYCLLRWPHFGVCCMCHVLMCRFSPCVFRCRCVAYPSSHHHRHHQPHASQSHIHTRTLTYFPPLFDYSFSDSNISISLRQLL